MARRRKKRYTKRRVVRSRSYAAPKRYRRKSSKSKLLGGMKDIVLAGLYGYGRSKLSAMMQPVTAKLPAGNYADNLALGGAALLIGKFAPKYKKYTNPVLIVEASNIGQKLSGGAGSSYSAVSTAKVYS